ncbi:hypothetical protein JCM1841_000007 [Sporobolomyces salmonicolor]
MHSTRSGTLRALSRLHSTSCARPAAVLNSAPTSPSPPPPAAPSPLRDPPLKPQPFIPRPLSRSYQLESLSTAPHDPASSITLRFVSPSDPRSAPRTLSLPNLFLRDASVHPDHVHPSSNQKLFRTTDVPVEGKLVGYGVHDIPGKGDCLVTEWSTPLQGAPVKSAKLSVVPLDVLVALMKGDRSLEGKLPSARVWDRPRLDQTLVRTPYDQFMSSDSALFDTLDGLVKDGIVFLTGVPTSPREGHHTELRKAVERIGSLRRTWYGDLWDVKAEEASKNIAYTNLDLGLHMDLTHFANPPRYQFLHSLLNTSITGGSSYFVDAYALAAHLHAHHPSHFTTLCTEPVQFEYKNGPHWTRFARPTFELEPGSTSQLRAVNYSPPFQGRLPLERLARGRDASVSDDAARLHELHEALAAFAALADDADGTWRWTHQLEPGECVVFDNRRVLHARTAFEFVDAAQDQDGGEGERGRWLKGAYMDGEEVWSRWRVLEETRRGKGRGRTLFK